MYKKIFSLHDKKDALFVFESFVIWKIVTLLIILLSIRYVSLFSNNFLGGGLQNYSSNPVFWGNINFDGEHYLAISLMGYQPLTYFYFPIFPLIVRALSLSHEFASVATTGVLVSNSAFLVALVGLYKIVKLDYKEHIAKLTIILLLIFPTSFYFGAYYTESIFLMFVVWSFYFAKRGNFLVASSIVAFASATRIIGVLMFPVLVIEYFLSRRKKKSFIGIDAASILISPLGLLIYMYYLWRQTGDALNFLNTVSIFGQQRSSSLVLLPQVFYRYIFKILPNVSYSYFPNFFTTYLEFGVATIFLIFIIYGIWKLRPSYTFFAFFAYLIPTLAGSFSSMPRYALTIFPVFILMSLCIEKMPRVGKYLIISVMLILFAVSTAMFWRGYWLS